MNNEFTIILDDDAIKLLNFLTKIEKKSDRQIITSGIGQIGKIVLDHLCTRYEKMEKSLQDKFPIQNINEMIDLTLKLNKNN